MCRNAQNETISLRFFAKKMFVRRQKERVYKHKKKNIQSSLLIQYYSNLELFRRTSQYRCLASKQYNQE